MKIDDPQITTAPNMKDNWVLTEDFSYKGNGIQITLPKGFVTDLASIPRILWAIIAPFELSLTAPIIHDWFYRNKGIFIGGKEFSRKDTDKLFLNIMKYEKVSCWRRYTAYYGVRMFGGSSWGASKVKILKLEGV